MVKHLIAAAICAAFTFAPIGNANQVIKVESEVVIDAKSELMALLANINNMSASFNQVVEDVDGEQLQEGKGEFTLAKPNLLHWQTSEPDESTIISDGESLWLFDPFIEQVTVYPLSQSIANTPILLLTSDDQALWQNYNISKKDDHSFAVVSKDEEAQVKQLTLGFDGKELNSFTIIDATGQQSKFSLDKIASNQTLPETLFTFNVPEGVLVDDQR